MSGVKVAFLDRDGTLNEDKGYVYRWSDFEWIPGVKSVLKSLKAQDYRLVVATNQSGIARGFYTEDAMLNLHRKMDNDLFASHGIRFDRTLYCPHHPDVDGACECRKPGTRLLEETEDEFGSLDRDRSFMVGDKISDIETGLRFGIRSFWLKNTNYPGPDENPPEIIHIRELQETLTYL